MRGLFEAELGQLQRLIDRTDLEIGDAARARGGDHVVVATGAVGVIGDERRVAALNRAGAPATPLSGPSGYRVRGRQVFVRLETPREQCVERGLVQPPALPPEQRAGDRLADQRVPEHEFVLARFHEHAAVDELAQGPDELRLAHPGHRGQQVERDALAEHGGGLEETQLSRLEVVALPAQHFGEAPRQRLIAELLQVARVLRAQQLLQVERVAAGALVQRHHRAVRRRPTSRLRQQLRRSRRRSVGRARDG